MEARITKWGDGLGICLPNSCTIEANIKEGSKVNIIMSRGKIEIIPIAKKENSLSEMLSQITEENMHHEY